MKPTAFELREADAWQTLAAAEDRPAFREACEGIVDRLRAGWNVEPTAARNAAVAAPVKPDTGRELFAAMRASVAATPTQRK